MGETFTDKLKLTKRDTGDLNWGAGHNSNLDLLDAHAQQGTLRPPRTLLATLGSGAVGSELLGNTTYFYKITAINEGETTENKIPVVLEAQVSQPATPLPVIVQWDSVKGATGYRIYKSSTSGQEKFLVEVSGEATVHYTDDGNTATNAGISVPATNDAFTSVKKLIAGANVILTPSHGKGEVQIDASAGAAGVTSLKKTGEASGLTGDVELEEGAGVQLTQDGPNNKINVANAGVTGVRKLGEASPLAGDVKLEAGTNITLTQDGPNNKILIDAAGGGGSVTAYQTVVVDAPTGIAATDTANINNALSAASTAGGGIVQLREGTYNINAALNISSKVTLQGMGREATVILGDPTMGALSMISMSGSDNGLRDLTIDENEPNRAGGSPFSGSLFNSTRPLIENVKFTRNKSNGSFVFLGTGGQMRNCFVDNNGAALSTAIVQGGELIDGCVITQNQTGNVNDFMQQPSQVLNCRLIRNSGTLSGAGIRMSTSNKVAVGNLIAVGSGNNAIILGSGSAASVVVGNIMNGATILLELNAANHIVLANANAVITDNSASSNSIADNFVTGLRKLGEASFLAGGVELEQGSNVTLTQDGANNKITIAAAAGGGGGGYATVVVAAPTGVAATDTANINAALTTASGGGRVVLREGTYRLSTLLTIPDHVVFEGQGKQITIIEADPTMVGGMLQTSGSDHQIKHITFDANHDAPRGGTNTFNEYFFNTANLYIEDCEFLDTHSSVGVMFNKGGSLQDRAIIRNCRFATNFGALNSGIITQGQLVEGCEFFQNATVAGLIAHYISGVDMVRNCFFEHSSGTFTRAIFLSVGQSAIGNWVRSMTGTVIEISGGTNNVIVQSNYLGGNGNIVIQAGVTDSVVMGNTGTANVTDNSGSGTNSISDNK